MFILAQETINLEILHQPSIPFCVQKLTTLKDEVFMLCSLPGVDDLAINVYDRNNMVKVKDVIPLTEILHPEDDEDNFMAACSVSNCVYFLNGSEMNGASIFRITKDEHQFKISTWIKNVRLPFCDMWPMGPISVSPDGSLTVLSRRESPKPTLVGIYNADGSVQNKIRLSPATYGFDYVASVSQKSSGNLLVVASYNDQYRAKLLEIDTSGRTIHEYQFSFCVFRALSFVDIYDRTLITARGNSFEVLDSEFNILDIAVPWRVEKPLLFSYQMHYNRERNEMLGIYYDWNTKTAALDIFPITEE